MFRVFIRISALLLLIAVGSMTLLCISPIENMEWNSKTDLPVSSEKFRLGSEFDNLFDMKKDSMEILNVDWRLDSLGKKTKDTTLGDTVIFSSIRHDTSTFVTREDTIGRKIFTAMLGPIAISNTMPITGTVPLSGNLTVNQSLSIPLPVVLPNIYEVTISDSSSALNLQLQNTTNAILANVVISIATKSTPAIVNIENLNANETKTAQVSLRGKSFDSTTTVTLTGTVVSAVTIPAGSGINLSMNFNGMTATRITAKDSILAFTKEIVNNYEITDTVNMSYIDLQSGDFDYFVTNYSGIDLKIKLHHQHLWSKLYCYNKNIIKYTDLNATNSDSLLYYKGGTGATIDAPRSSSGEAQFNRISLSSNRLLTVWDSTLEKTVSPVKYIVSTPIPRGDRITLRANDSLKFVIRPNGIQFDQFYGILMYPYKKKSDTTSQVFPFPWSKSDKDSLKGKFVLSRAIAYFRTEIAKYVQIDSSNINRYAGMPKGAYLDTLQMKITMFTKNSSIVCTTTTRFSNVHDSALYIRELPIQDLINLFPDSVYAVVDLSVPAGTRMLVKNDLEVADPDYMRSIGRMQIHTDTKFRLNVYNEWQVKDSVSLDLGSGKFKVPEALRYVNKMREKNVSFNMKMLNATNVYARIYALVAPQKDMQKLIKMSSDSVRVLLKQDNPDGGFVNLLGKDGILIPEKKLNKTIFNSVKLNDKQIETILGSDSCAWRWQIKFLKQDAVGALHDTDFIKIDSWLHADGVNRMDSLFIWE